MVARLVAVTAADSPEIAAYTRMRDRDLARVSGSGDGFFVAEGEVVVRVLASRASRFRVRSLLVEERRVAALRDVVEVLSEDVVAYVAPQSVMDAVVGFSIHRGILALGERGPPLDAASLLVGSDSSIAVGLVGLTNHDNVGGVFRNAAAFGVRPVLLDGATCDPLYRKSVRVSVGGALLVPFASCASPAVMLDTIAAAGWEALALSARGEETIAEAVHGGERSKRHVLLLGTEGEGLPESVMSRVRRVRIDMAPGLDSLNVAVASGIAIYEASKRRS